MVRGKIRFVLQETLDEINITPFKLSKVSNVRAATIYQMCDNNTERIHIPTLISIIYALNAISKEQQIHRKFDINDVIVYTHK